MPRPVTYKRDSIIYFQGDVSDKVFVLKDGRVSMTFRDIETGKDMRELIQRGEFFGVKSAMGRYPREENVIALSDCIVLVFSVQEFEEFAGNNTRVVMKMLKVFSNQLRRMHIKVRTLLATDDHLDPELGLVRTGDYFYSKKRLSQAVYAYQRYIELYPDGRYIPQAQKGIEACGNYSGGKRAAEEDLKGAAKRFYEALSLFGREQYEEAQHIFQEVVNDPAGAEYCTKAAIEIGRCYYYLKRYKDAVQHLSSLVQNQPRVPDIEKALFYIARSHEELGSTDRAAAFYQRILSMKGLDPDFRSKVSNALRRMEGKA